MKFKICKRKRRVICGVKIDSNGIETPFATENDLDCCGIEVSIFWHGKIATMFCKGGYSNNHNATATRLLGASNVLIHGPVFIVTQVEQRFKMSIWATGREVRDAISHMHFANPLIFGLQTWTPRQDIYSVLQEDLIAVRMCI